MRPIPKEKMSVILQRRASNHSSGATVRHWDQLGGLLEITISFNEGSSSGLYGTIAVRKFYRTQPRVRSSTVQRLYRVYAIVFNIWITYCHTHSNSFSNKRGNSLLAVRDVHHKSIMADCHKMAYLSGFLGTLRFIG